MSSFPLFTSIKPPGEAAELSYLRDCVDSWRMAGFNTIVVNGPGETEALRQLKLPVEFHVISTDGRPRIGTILAAINERGPRFAGIINSDCRIIGYPDLASNFQASLERTVLVTWRMDVGYGKPKACLGFDAYFFDTAILPEDDFNFRIGGPWWDYWFPLACEVRGARIETLPTPLMTHKAHPLNYSLQHEIDGGLRFWTALKTWYGDGRHLPSWPFGEIYHRDKTQNTLSWEQLCELSSLVRSWIRKNDAQAVLLLPLGMGEVATILRLCGDALLDVGDLRGEIALLKKSASWRITAPLRAAAIAARKVAAFS
jgi:hypothetical protein